MIDVEKPGIMQTELIVGKGASAVKPATNGELMKKFKPEEKEMLLVLPKGEPRDDDNRSSPNTSNPSEKTDASKQQNGDNLLINGLFDDITELSSDEETDVNTTNPDTNTDQDKKLSLKKEELTDLKMLEQEEMLLNEDDDDLDINDANGQFPFSVDTNDLVSSFLDDDNTENPLISSEFENAGILTNDDDENDLLDEISQNADSATGNAESEINNDTLNETQTEDSEQTTESETQQGTETSDTSETSSSENSLTENSTIDQGAEPNVKDAGDAKSSEEVDTDAKRPSSQESATSTTSTSSERTLTIRSTSDVNKLVSNSAIVKKEKLGEDSTPTPAEPAPEKPHSGGLSILNPSQLGASNNAGGENLLQNVNFTQPGDQMIGFLGAGMQSNVPLQCDVCEIQFPDSMMLDEHKANAGHYKCHFAAECATLVFQSLVELSGHQQSVHGMIARSPVQQLAHQVQSLPIPYQMDQPMGSNYAGMTQYTAAGGVQGPRGVVPQVYGSQGNVQLRPYNSVQASGPRLQIGSVRGSVPMGNQPNNLKRAAPMQTSRLVSPKRGRPDYSRNGDTDCKVVSIQKPDNTDDVVAQLSKSITITARQDSQKKSDTAAVTNMLANRGITVSSVSPKQNRNASAVAMLNLNSAVSLIPTNNANKNSGFAIPQGRISSGPRQAVPNSPTRLQTVDLTGPDPPRNRQMNRTTNRFQCQICDRTFFNQDQLNQHMITHRSGSRKQLPYKCNMCTAQYPTSQGLQQHKQTFHRDTVTSTNEMVIPIVDLKQPGALQRLQNLGINHMIPLNALGSQQANGNFGIPVLPFSSDRTTINNMTNSGISNILPVGPLRSIR